MAKHYDVVIIGAGAAGLAAAATAITNDKKVAILEIGDSPARKVSISGGGRCNFTNAAVSVDKYFGQNPNFVRSAISRITPNDILKWAYEHQIKWEEKNPGQYFCSTGAKDIVKALLKDAKNADLFLTTLVTNIEFIDNKFYIYSKSDEFIATSLIIATGGTSFQTVGVSDFGYKIAKQFGHKIIPVRPALCAIQTNSFSSDLSGIAINVEITIAKHKIKDSMLFTHFGIGGPAIYKTTVRDFNDIHINLLPDTNAYDFLRSAKQKVGRKSVANVLSEKLPMRLAKWICNDTKNIADYKDAELKLIAGRISNITVTHKDIKLHNLQSAEVVRGGVDTSNVSSKTMESKLQPRLFFVGEVLDVAGDLGGFNLHWAWASGRIAGENA